MKFIDQQKIYSAKFESSHFSIQFRISSVVDKLSTQMKTDVDFKIHWSNIQTLMDTLVKA